MCEDPTCDEDATHVVHLPGVGDGLALLCRTHAYRLQRQLGRREAPAHMDSYVAPTVSLSVSALQEEAMAWRARTGR